MRRTDNEIEAEADRLERAADAEPVWDRRVAIGAAASTLRQRVTPGQVTTAHGEQPEDRCNAMMAAANWAYGLTEDRPSDRLSDD